MYRATWQATVHGVAKRRTWLSVRVNARTHAHTHTHTHTHGLASSDSDGFTVLNTCCICSKGPWQRVCIWQWMVCPTGAVIELSPPTVTVAATLLRVEKHVLPLGSCQVNHWGTQCVKNTGKQKSWQIPGPDLMEDNVKKAVWQLDSF